MGQKGRSTLSNLTIFTAFESHDQVDEIYTDFAKAFDNVDHKYFKQMFYTVSS